MKMVNNRKELRENKIEKLEKQIEKQTDKLIKLIQMLDCPQANAVQTIVLIADQVGESYGESLGIFEDAKFEFKKMVDWINAEDIKETKSMKGP